MKRSIQANQHIIIAALLGLFSGAITWLNSPLYLVPLAAWDAFALCFLVLTWTNIWNLDGTETRRHARREDPTRPLAQVLALLAAVASLGAAALVMSRHGADSSQQLAAAGVTVMSVVLSWFVVHTLYALHYAVLYYSDGEGGVNFNQNEAPTYVDFAYLAFTIGMTFQVSDTAIRTPAIRKASFAHALFAYLFGTIIIAITINLVAGLGR